MKQHELLKIHKAALIISLQIFRLPAHILYDPKFCPFPDYYEFRDFRSFEDENFKSDLRRESWDSIYKCNEVNECYTRFLHIFNKVSNIHAPLKKAKIKHKAYKPWITSGLKKSMKVRDKLYKKWLITYGFISAGVP